MKKGFFITFEGCEGCGKSTQFTRLVKNLEKRGFPVIKTREPGGIPIGEKIRDILLDTKNTNLAIKAEFFLFMANRAQHVNELIKPSLEKGKIVLCDRYEGSTFAYQHFARGLHHLEKLQDMNSFATDFLKPDLTILLDIDPTTGIKRRGNDLSRIDRESLEFHQKVRQGYLDLDKADPRWTKLDGHKTIDELEAEVLNTVMGVIK